MFHAYRLIRMPAALSFVPALGQARSPRAHVAGFTAAKERQQTAQFEDKPRLRTVLSLAITPFRDRRYRLAKDLDSGTYLFAGCKPMPGRR